MTETVTPKDYCCPWCGHHVASHSSLCYVPHCHCNVTQKRLRWKARKWVRQENRRLRREDEAEQRKVQNTIRSLDDLINRTERN